MLHEKHFYERELIQSYFESVESSTGVYAGTQSQCLSRIILVWLWGQRPTHQLFSVLSSER
jgi:hypothetical protein